MERLQQLQRDGTTMNAVGSERNNNNSLDDNVSAILNGKLELMVIDIVERNILPIIEPLIRRTVSTFFLSSGHADRTRKRSPSETEAAGREKLSRTNRSDEVVPPPTSNSSGRGKTICSYPVAPNEAREPAWSLSDKLGSVPPVQGVDPYFRGGYNSVIGQGLLNRLYAPDFYGSVVSKMNVAALSGDLGLMAIEMANKVMRLREISDGQAKDLSNQSKVFAEKSKALGKAEEKVKALIESLAQKEADLKEFCGRLDAANKSLDKAKGTRDELRGQKEVLEKRNAELADKLEATKQQVLTLESAVDKISEEELLPLKQFQLEKDALLAAARKDGAEEYKNSQEYKDELLTEATAYYVVGCNTQLRNFAATGKFSAEQLAIIGSLISSDVQCLPGHALVPLSQEEIDNLELAAASSLPTVAAVTVTGLIDQIDNLRFDLEGLSYEAAIARLFPNGPAVSEIFLSRSAPVSAQAPAPTNQASTVNLPSPTPASETPTDPIPAQPTV